MKIPFNRPYLAGKELGYIGEAHANMHLSGDGAFTTKCQSWLEKCTNRHKALLTHSCTGALEMAAILADIQPGDEVIMPSYTFPSAANAIVLRGGAPVFVDIREDTLNIDESKIEDAITKNTKAIVPVHYAGVACEMDAIMTIAVERKLIIIEDSAQGILSYYKGRPLGSIGDLAALSFHATKNISSGEGGALLINDPRWIERAEIIREKGTDRSKFFRGEVDKYSWVDVGSSFLPSKITAAFLWAQLEKAEEITRRRIAVWERYYQAFASLEADGLARRPVIPSHCRHNGHLFYLLLPDLGSRDAFIKGLNALGVNAVFHYIPLHSSIAGKKYGRTNGDLIHTRNTSDRLARLPLWSDMEEEHILRVIRAVYEVMGKNVSESPAVRNPATGVWRGPL